MDVAGAAYEAIRAGDWTGLRLLLHPYLHWVAPDGEVTCGRTKVLAMLQSRPNPPDRPSGIELRDGEIYRWTS